VKFRKIPSTFNLLYLFKAIQLENPFSLNAFSKIKCIQSSDEMLDGEGVGVAGGSYLNNDSSAIYNLAEINAK